MWFGASPRLELDNGRLTISTPSPLFQDWLRTNFRSQIEAVCREALGQCPALEFRVDPAVAQRPADSTPESGAAAKPPSSGEPHARAAAAEGQRQSSQPGRSGRLRRRRPADLDSFVTGRSNRLARAAAELAIDRPGEIPRWSFTAPPASARPTSCRPSGEPRARRPGSPAVYLSAEQFTAGFVEAVRGSGLPSFRQKCRGVGLLLIDDLQFLTGKKATQVELLYTMDTLLREGRQMVFAADRPPAELTDLGPELCTRLQSGMVCRIDPPDYETRLAILDQMARRGSSPFRRR